jgi:hypothetical protein
MTYTIVDMKATLASLILCATLASCATTVKTGTAKSMEIYGPGVVHRPVMVDLDVQQTKVSATKTFTSSTLTDVAKSELINQVLKENHADVLIEPTFESETIGSHTQMTVHGFPATYKNFRPMQPEDVPLLQAGVLQQAKEAEPAILEKQKKKGGGVAAVILVLVLIAAAIAGSTGM